MPKPRVRTGPADTYSGSDEKIVEFSNGARSASTHKGGLISLRNTDDGTLSVHLYRLDAGIDVQVSESESIDLLAELGAVEARLERARRTTAADSIGRVEVDALLRSVRQTIDMFTPNEEDEG